MSEQQIQQRIRLALGQGLGVRLFRNNVGCLNDQRGQLVRYGLCAGSADLIGITTVTITPEMVGRQVGLFTAIEVKAPRGRVSPEQQAFLDMVQRQGGLAGIARSVEDAEAIIAGGNPYGSSIVSVCDPMSPNGVSCDQPQASTPGNATA